MKKILYLLILTVIIPAICCCSKGNNSINTGTVTAIPSAHTTNVPTVKPSNSEITDTETEKEPTIYKVYFYETDDNLIYSEEVEEGKSVKSVPSAAHYANTFFSGWNGLSEHINGNTKVYAIYKSITNVKNAIGFDSVYVKMGQEFGIDIAICGDVEFASLELEITFDACLNFKGIPYTDKSAVSYYSEDEDKIFVALAYRHNITDEVDICKINFVADSVSMSDAIVEIKVNDIACLNNSNAIIDIDYSVYNEKIIIEE